MANGIEWSTATIPPAIADREDVLVNGAIMDDDEIAIWTGSDGAAVLYGTRDELIAWANELLTLMSTKTDP